MKPVAFIIGGCGHRDGTEIHEATMAMLALDQQNIPFECFAPNNNQVDVINHLTGEPMNESRNLLIEAARIARGKIKPLSDANPEAFSGALLPGGFGAAKNLSTFAKNPESYDVDPDLRRFLTALHAAGKPMAFLCIAPVIAAKLFGSKKVEVTIGHDATTAAAIEKTGAMHTPTETTGVVIDQKNKIVTTPCYMMATRISEIYEGASKAIKALAGLLGH